MALAKLPETIKCLLENSPGANIFLGNRSNFENWLQVELCGKLSGPDINADSIEPESSMPRPIEGSIDIVFTHKREKYAIELKLVIASNKKAPKNKLKGKPKNKATSLHPIEMAISKLSHAMNERYYDHSALILITYPLNNAIEIKKFTEKLLASEWVKKCCVQDTVKHPTMFSAGANGAIYLLQLCRN